MLARRLGFIVGLLLAGRAYGRPALVGNPVQSIFTATHAVIVSHVKDDGYKVEKSFLGALQAGDKITLPSFKPVTWDVFGDDVAVSITDDTRILLYLKPDEKNPKLLVPTYYGSGYFLRDADHVEELEGLAKKALAYRGEWEKARDVKDAKARVAALWPYLFGTGVDCLHMTLDEMAKTGPVAGDYLAERLGTYSGQQLDSLLNDMYRIPSAKAHDAAVEVVKTAKVRFENFLAERRLEAVDVLGHWNDGTLTEEFKDQYGVIYYGLAAVSNFKEKKDVPWMRELVPWLLKNNLGQPIEVCVNTMERCPAAENVAVLKAVWEDYKSRAYPVGNEPLLPIDLARALGAQGERGAVPILIEMLGNSRGHDTALSGLRDLTGQDLKTAEEWKAWDKGHPDARVGRGR